MKAIKVCSVNPNWEGWECTLGGNYFCIEKSPLIRQCFWLFHQDASENSRVTPRAMKDAAANQVINGTPELMTRNHHGVIFILGFRAL